MRAERETRAAATRVAASVLDELERNPGVLLAWLLERRLLVEAAGDATDRLYRWNP